MSRRLRVICVLLLTMLVACLPFGCDSSERIPDEVTLQVNWFHAPEFVGYYVASAKGFYEDEDLDVTIHEGGPGIQARLYMLDGRADFAVASFGEQLNLVQAGEPSVAVMAVFQIPPLVMFALADSGIEEPQDFVGKRVGVKNNYWRDVLHETLTNANVDPSEVVEVSVEADAQHLLYEGDVDIWMGYASDEPIRAEVAGYEVVSIYPADYGVGGYEGLLLANEGTVNQDPDMVGRFVRASQRGLQYAVQHPDEAAQIITQWQAKDSVEFNELAVRALIPLVDIPQAAIGWIEAKRWEQLMGSAYDAQHPGYTMDFLQS